MDPHAKVLLLHVVLYSVSALTMALNLLVIISISHYRQLHTPTNLLLLSLAVSDFLMGLLMPGDIGLVGGCWYLSNFMCCLYYFVGYTLVSTSVGHMVLISVDRYVAICDPLRCPTRVTLRRVKLCVCLCWLCAASFNFLLLKDHLRQPGLYISCRGECVLIIDHIAGVVDMVSTLVCPITVIVVLYMRVFVVAVSQARAMRSHIMSVTLQRSGTVTAKKSELKAARTLGVVVAVFLICFIPYYCPSLAGQDTLNTAFSVPFGIWLLYCNSCLNPLIYALFYPWFRKAVKLVVTLQILKPNSCKTNVLQRHKNGNMH
ncbi:trace amine-associated receptor 13c-like [Myripristis murdjan]|uniref:trace amine-associated receptor 13c-like n=1 Tax=Myripristis murdjan TaxID=586833 RepID=UPI0011763A7E|nr:trace amine-associated receptor 13c-like [Myripristis murdjan]